MILKHIFSLIFFLYFAYSNTLFASTEILEEIKTKPFSIAYFYDATKELSIREVEEKTFSPAKSQFTYGFKKGNIWFKLDIENKSQSEDFVLSLNEPYFSDVILYIKEDTHWSEDKNGINTPLEERSIFNHHPMFNIHIKKDSNKTIYLKLHSMLTTSGEIEIHNKEYLNSLKGYSKDLLYMFYFGAIFVISLVNLFLYFRMKERVYLYYSGYTFFYILWLSLYSGHILYLGVQSFYYNLMMVTPMFIMFMILFSVEFLNVKNILPKLYKPIHIFAYTFGVLALLIMLSFEPWFELMNSLASILFLVLFSLAFLILKKTNNINTKYYIFAMFIYMVTVSLMSAMTNGWIENNDINRYSFLFGSLFEIVFFTLIITNRFNEAQKELIDIKTKNELLLKKEVEDKTKDISKLLNEKELLLQELYHRVKNNFHIIIGLLWMEKDKATDKNVKELFQKVLFRIKSMSSVHQYLYESDSLKQFDTYEYIHKTINQIKAVYISDKIIIEKKIESIKLDVDSALSVGMIINELLTNSIKHNSNTNQSLNIKIVFIKEDKYIKLKVSDNGVGFDNKEKNQGLGLKLIEQLSKKLSNSSYLFKNDKGVKFELVFTPKDSSNAL